MWKTPASRKGQHIIKAARRLATESASPKQNVPPLNVPKPPSKSGGFKALKFIGLSLPVVAGGVVGYAWYDVEFRKQIEDNVPYAKELFGNILPKEEEKAPAAKTYSPQSLSIGKAPVLNSHEEDKKKKSAVGTISKKADERPSEKSIAGSSQETATERRNDMISPSFKTQRSDDDEDKSDNAALEVVIHKLATSSQNVIAEAVKAQTEVATCIRNQTKLLKQAMDESTDILSKDAQWEAVANAYKDRESATIRANELLVESKKNVEKLRDILQEGKNNRVTQNNPAIIPAAKQLNTFLKELGNATSQVRQAETEASVIQRYKDLVEKGKKQFQKEIESLIPPDKLASGKKLSEEDLNTLIGHAHVRIGQLQMQIAEQLSMEKQRFTAALEAQRQEDIKRADSVLSEERLNLQKEFQLEKSHMDMEYLEHVESEVRKQLARQSAAHTDHLKDALTAQQQALDVEYQRKVHVRLLEEKEKFHQDVAGWISRLKGIETAVEARATSEKLARCAQDLWLACIALSSVIYTSGGAQNERELTPLQKHIDLILEAGQKHPFVENVARALPNAALFRGVSTEDELRQRFLKVSRICRRLGLVDATNSSMYTYLVSYLHSFVVLDNVVGKGEGDEIDLSSLDNFALLSHANYWMAKGNLDIAMRFMIQLKGESRRAASDWIREAQLLLETKQIASTLMAYASATGLANTF
jgi:mitofilin